VRDSNIFSWVVIYSLELLYDKLKGNEKNIKIWKLSIKIIIFLVERYCQWSRDSGCKVKKYLKKENFYTLTRLT